MKLIRYGHACIRIEADRGAVVVDAGEFSEPESVRDAVALMHTHGHYDHLSVEYVASARAGNPDVEVFVPAETLTSRGMSDAQPLAAGDLVEVAGIPISVSGGRHAEVYPGQDSGENVALLIAGRIFHPGDSFTRPPTAVETLLLPIHSPWSRLSEVVDYAKDVAPQRVIPIHDALLSDKGRLAFDRNITNLLGDGIAYRRLAIGEACEI